MSLFEASFSKPEETVEGLKKRIVGLEREVDLLKHDSLTGFLDHRQFYKDLAALMEGTEEVSVVMIDLNCLTYYNGLGGHLCGSEAIKILAELIQEVGGNFIPYRYAGDEFTIIIRGNQDEAKTIVGAVQERLSRLDLAEKKSEIREAELPLSISVGMAAKQEAEQKLAKQQELDPSKSKFQILAELITDIADQRSLAEKQAHHRTKIQELYEQDQKKCWQLIPYLLKGAKLRGEEVEAFLKPRPERVGIV